MNWALVMAVSGVGLGMAPPPGPAARAFERLKAMEGRWEARSAGGPRVEIRYEVISGGTAVLERVIADEHGPAGMASIYYLEGDHLAMAHYCTAGNQPRFRSVGLEGSTVQFELVPGTVAPGEGHVRAVTFRFQGGMVESDWDAAEGAGAGHRLTRHQTRLR